MLLQTLHYHYLFTVVFSLVYFLMQAGPVVCLSEPLLAERSSDDDVIRICPLPRCKTCKTAEQIVAPGVGFALEMGYGTAALRLHNGTYQTIAYIEGTSSYTSLLQRFASGPENRIPHDIPSQLEQWHYAKKRIQRLLNKFLGRPANPETAILADLISMLKIKTESMLGDGQKVTAAVLSSPDRVALTAEEITDVFDYLRIRNLMAEPDTFENFHATSSAYAGLGMGLCNHYTDPYVCEREEARFPHHWLLYLNFVPDSLSGTIKSLRSIRNGLVHKEFIDSTLGLGRLDALDESKAFGTDEERAYWTAVTNRIRGLVLSMRPKITQLILTGTSAADPRFKAVVMDALRDLVAERALEILDGQGDGRYGREGTDVGPDLVFATANGAAEVAKRRQEGPVRCAETDRCKEVRKRFERQERGKLEEL